MARRQIDFQDILVAYNETGNARNESSYEHQSSSNERSLSAFTTRSHISSSHSPFKSLVRDVFPSASIDG